VLHGLLVRRSHDAPSFSGPVLYLCSPPSFTGTLPPNFHVSRLSILHKQYPPASAFTHPSNLPFPPPATDCSWHAHLLGEYRRSARVTNRAELKALRATAEDTLAYLGALGEHRVSGGVGV